MQPIATVFEKHTFRYTQLERQGNLAIYTQEHKETGSQSFEVVRIRVRPAHTWPDGRTTPEHEAYPSAQSGGAQAWTCFTLAEARALLADLRSASVERSADA